LRAGVRYQSKRCRIVENLCWRSQLAPPLTTSQELEARADRRTRTEIRCLNFQNLVPHRRRLTLRRNAVEPNSNFLTGVGISGESPFAPHSDARVRPCCPFSTR
jgi:hypothetical protein